MIRFKLGPLEIYGGEEETQTITQKNWDREKYEPIDPEESMEPERRCREGRLWHFLYWLFGAQYHKEILLYCHDERGLEIIRRKERQRIRHFIRRVVFYPEFDGGIKVDLEMLDFNLSEIVDSDGHLLLREV